MTSNAKTAIFWLVLICVAILFFFIAHRSALPEISFDLFMEKLRKGQIAQATIHENQVDGFTDGSNERFRATIPSGCLDLYDQLVNRKVIVKVEFREFGNWIFKLLNGSPVIVLVLLWIILIPWLRKPKASLPNEAALMLLLVSLLALLGYLSRHERNRVSETDGFSGMLMHGSASYATSAELAWFRALKISN